MGVQSDDRLWAEIRCGSTAAFAALFERHAPTLFAYLLRRTADAWAADDLLSTTFLEAWRRRDVAVEKGAVLAWLYGIATNVLHNQRRSTRRYKAALARLAPPGDEPGFAADVVDRIEQEARLESVLVALRKLPQHEQDVIALVLWSELSYEEAARALGVAVGTVRSRLARARSRLRELDVSDGHVEKEAAAERIRANEP